MKEKLIYDAPEVETVNVRVEQNILDTSVRSAISPDDMDTHNASEWGSWE